MRDGDGYLIKCVVCLFLLSVLFIVGGSSEISHAGEKRIKLRFYYHASPQGGQAKFIRTWIKNVEKAIDDKLDIVFFPGASLGPPMEAYKMIESGVVDMGCIVVGFYPGRFPLTEVLQLPFLGLPSGVVGSRVYWDLYEKFPEFRNEYSGVKVLILYTDAPTPIGSNRAIRSHGDLKGLKIRALSGSPTEMLKSLGGYPILMSSGDIYTSMERNLIDAWMFSWEGCMGQRLQDVTRYFTTANTYEAALCLLMNQTVWDNLPTNIKKVVDEHSGATGAEFFGEEFDRFNKIGIEQVSKMKDKEIIILTPEEADKWKELCRPVWSGWLSDMEERGLPGQAVLNEAQRLLEKYVKQYH